MKLSTILTATAFALVASARGVVPPRQNTGAPNLGYRKLLELQQGFWDRFKYPNNIKEAESINSTIFSEDVEGRVSDTRNFVGRELNTEYIFGLFIPAESVSIIGIPGDWEIIQFVANQNIASATTRVQFTFPAFSNITLPVVIDTWLTWNEKGEITQYDVVFRWFAYMVQTLILLIDPNNPTNATTQAVGAIAQSICATHSNYCHDANQQYASSDECFNFLTKQIRVGQAYEMGMNTLMCRSVHEKMVKFRPDVHCSHIGKFGGGMCDDSISYMTKVTENYFTNSPWIPTIF